MSRPAVVTFLHRHGWVVLALLMALHVGLALLTFMPQPHTGGDSLHYLTLARSLVEHGTYTDLYDPLQPPHTKYPPVFPLVLAGGILIGLTTWVQLKFVVILMGAGAIALTYLWIRRRGRPALATGVALLLAVSPGVLEQSRWVLSDVPFWFFTMLALWAFERLGRRSRVRLAIAIVAVVLAYFTRSAGLPLVLAAIAWLAWRRRWTQLAVFAAVLAPLAVLWWLRAQNTGGVAYAQEFWFINPYRPDLGMVGVGDLLQRILTNAFYYATIHVPTLLTGRPGVAAAALTLLITGLGVFGWVTRLRRLMVAELLMPLYLGLILLWPSVWSGERFILPIFPLLLYYAGVGAVRVVRVFAPVTVLAGAAVVTAILLLMMKPALAVSIANGRVCSAQYRDGDRFPCVYESEDNFLAAAEWSGQALPPSAVVLSRKPRIFYAISEGIRSTNYPMTDDPATFFALADSVGARYVLFDRMTTLSDMYLAPVLAAHSNAFCLVQQFGEDGTALFGIREGARDIPPTPPDAFDGTIQPCRN